MDFQSYCALVVGFLGSYYVISNLYRAGVARYKLRSIPAIGPSGIFSSYLGAWRFILHGKEMVQEGYDKYPGAVFRVPLISKWMIVVSGRRMIDDIRKATDDQVSFEEAVAETVQSDYTMGPEILGQPYHIAVVRSPLTRNLTSRFPDVRDEIAVAFTDYIPPSGDWVKVPAYSTIMHVVCRTSNRLFVGLSLCRDPDYRALNEEFTIFVTKAANVINLFPGFLRPIVGRLLTKLPQSVERAKRHLGPIIKERLEMEEKLGPDYPDKPNDLISWLLEEAKGPHRSVHDLILRILAINFAAIHTTSIAFTGALYNLAAYPSYVPELREEIESVIAEEGLNKVSLQKMRKLDSFMKESARMNGNGGLTMTRRLLKDFTFSDGTVIPAGNTIAVAMYATHHDEINYGNPNEFDGFRFAKIRQEENEGLKHQMVALGTDFIAFGHGRHACPGRFFAVNEIKLMMVHVLLNYDVKLEDGVRPPDQWFMARSAPNMQASVMFRKRSA